MLGYYYLHKETKNLIFKHEGYEFTGDLIEKVWKIDTDNRIDAWMMILEGLALGANIKRVKELANKWGCDKEDFIEALTRINPTDILRKGAYLFIENIFNENKEDFWNELEKRKN